MDSSERRLEHLTARCPAQRCRRRRDGSAENYLLEPSRSCLRTADAWVFLSLSLAELRVSERITMTSSRRRRARTTTVLLYSWSSTYIWVLSSTNFDLLPGADFAWAGRCVVATDFFFLKKRRKGSSRRIGHVYVSLELGPPCPCRTSSPKINVCIPIWPRDYWWPEIRILNYIYSNLHLQSTKIQ